MRFRTPPLTNFALRWAGEKGRNPSADGSCVDDCEGVSVMLEVGVCGSDFEFHGSSDVVSGYGEFDDVVVE